VKLESLNGHFVELKVTGYQFGSDLRSTSLDVGRDANWLMIHGKAWDGAHSSEFDDPCMTTFEARELAAWLRELRDAGPVPAAAAERDRVWFWLTEPNLAFSLKSAFRGVTTLDVYFNAESRPPTGSNDDGEGLGHRIRLTMSQADIAKAVWHWDQDLQDFPLR
jgi:hypothetical protein